MTHPFVSPDHPAAARADRLSSGLPRDLARRSDHIVEPWRGDCGERSALLFSSGTQEGAGTPAPVRLSHRTNWVPTRSSGQFPEPNIEIDADRTCPDWLKAPAGAAAERRMTAMVIALPARMCVEVIMIFPSRGFCTRRAWLIRRR
jgi:hypothetical protein